VAGAYNGDWSSGSDIVKYIDRERERFLYTNTTIHPKMKPTLRVMDQYGVVELGWRN